MFKVNEGTVFTDGTIDLMVVSNYDGASEESSIPCYRCRLLLAGTDMRVGTISLRLKVEDNKEYYYDGNIGYLIREEHRGKGYALRGCKLAALIAKEEGMKELIISCNVENKASIKVIERLGAEIIEIIEVPEGYQDEYDRTSKRIRSIWKI